jgi:hypothetical protein
MDRIPTWPELAQNVANMWAYAVAERNQATARGDRREAAKWDKQARKLDEFMRKNRITIRA